MSRNGPSYLSRAIATAATAAAGVPLIDPLVQWMLTPLSQEIARRRSVALRTAEALAGCSREELSDRLSANPMGVDRLIRVIYAAGMNGSDGVLRMMGRCLVRGLDAAEQGDAERLEQESALLDSLDGLTPRHVRMLSHIETHRGIANGELSRAVSAWDAFPDRTASELVSLGLVEDPNGYWGDGEDRSRFYNLSDFGALLLRAAQEVAFEDI